MTVDPHTAVLADDLAYDDVLPVRFKPLPAPADESLAASLNEHNVRTLLALAALEEAGPVDKTDDKSPHAADLQRLELKMNLVLELLGQVLAANLPRPAVCPVRFNAHGAVWRPAGEPPLPGAHGVLEIHLRDALPQPLGFAARVERVEGGQVQLSFAPLAENTADLVEKLAFRRHRRQVAGVRNPRRP